MSYSQRRGFDPVAIFGWIRSEVAEGYRPARSRELTFDPWWQADPDCATAYTGAPVVVTW